MDYCNFSRIVTDRWNETVAEPTLAKWRNVAQLAAQLADSIEHEAPDHVLVPALRGVYEAAYARMVELQPKEVA